MDRRLRELKFGPNVTYLSLKDLLCNDSGCLTMVGPVPKTDLIVHDYGHLTEAGADFEEGIQEAPINRSFLTGPRQFVRISSPERKQNERK
jgi:hypothetical protein